MRDNMPVGRRETFQILAMNARDSRNHWMTKARALVGNAGERRHLVRLARIAHQEVLRVKRIARAYEVPV